MPLVLQPRNNKKDILNKKRRRKNTEKLFNFLGVGIETSHRRKRERERERENRNNK